jgi:hypothetical protein
MKGINGRLSIKNANTPLKEGFQLGKKNSPTGNIFFSN